MPCVRLAAGAYELELAPETGGSIARFTWQHPTGGRVDLMRPMPDAAIAARRSEDAGCFPLFPYSNRIRAGRFSFNGETFQLPLNTSEQHPQHGHGWQRPWDVLEATATRATIGFTHDPAQDPSWPFAYEARQTFALSADGLVVTLAARNLDTRPMPFGFGLHPYFPRTAGCTLQADVGGYWEADQEVMPTRHVPVPSRFDLRRGLPMQDIVIDNVFTGFGGAASIAWPASATRLEMRAGRALAQLVVYVPDLATQGAETAAGIPPYFCAEPVSNITDAVNLRASPGNGLILLEPGAETRAEITFAAAPL